MLSPPSFLMCPRKPLHSFACWHPGATAPFEANLPPRSPTAELARSLYSQVKHRRSWDGKWHFPPLDSIDQRRSNLKS